MTAGAPSAGSVRIYRELWNHTMFACEAEAAIFAWMICMAQWRPTTIRTKHGAVWLNTGELITAETVLAKRFLMHRNQVRKVIQRLVDTGSISLKRDHKGRASGTIVFIHNYKQYQASDDTVSFGQNNTNEPDGTTEGQQRDNNGTQNKESKELKKVKEEDSSPSESPAGRLPKTPIELVIDGAEPSLLPTADILALPKREAEAALELWQDLARELKLPLVMKFSDPRRRSLVARLKDAGGLDGWKAALEQVRASRLLRGEAPPRAGSDTPWCCTFDFLVSANGFTKVMEGNYRDGRGGGGTGDGMADLDAQMRRDGLL
jgi:hypothetical protein